jgi:hypothetical protein
MGVKLQVAGICFPHHNHLVFLNYRMTFSRPDEYGVEETVTELVPGKPSIAHIKKRHCSHPFVHDICIMCRQSSY